MMSVPVLADNSDQQTKVYNYCANASVPLLMAGTQYVSMTVNLTPTEVAKDPVMKTVTSSEQFKTASQRTKTSMLHVIDDVVQPDALHAHQKSMMDKGEKYLEVIGYIGYQRARCRPHMDKLKRLQDGGDLQFPFVM